MHQDRLTCGKRRDGRPTRRWFPEQADMPNPCNGEEEINTD